MRMMLRNDGPLVYVDDDVVEIMIARRNLALSSLHRELRTFDSGGAFLDYMDQVKAGREPMPPLVLLDLRMPLLDGFDVLQRVRADPSFQDLPPIVIFSNSDNPTDTERATHLGADAYWVKPSSSAAYVALFDQLARTAAPTPDAEQSRRTR